VLAALYTRPVTDGTSPSKPPDHRLLVPGVAVGIAVAYVGAALGPVWLLAGVVVLAVAAVTALPLLRRPGRALALTVVATAVWLTIGLTTALTLRDRPVTGLLVTLGVLFALPLPIIPWLYARTFPQRSPGSDEDQRP
jgi:hypothetical protein